MKRFRHAQIPMTAAIFAAAVLVAVGLGTPAAAEQTGLGQRFSANLHGDVITVGNQLGPCMSHDCPQTTAAKLSIPVDASIVHARMYWASGLHDACEADPPVTTVRLQAADSVMPVNGKATGPNTAEADVTDQLGGLRGDTTVAASGIRSDSCAAAWSLTLAYQTPPSPTGQEPLRHVAVYSGAGFENSITMDGFRRADAGSAHLTAAVYGDARLRINGTDTTTEATAAMLTADMPTTVLPTGADSASITFTGDDALVQQVAMSVPATELTFSATAVPQEVWPGDTVSYKVSASNPGTSRIIGAEFHIDMSRALDDATAPVAIAAARGWTTFSGQSLKWSGDVPAGGKATVTYAMKVKNPRPGDGEMDSTVVGGPHTNCSAKAPAPQCHVNLRFPPRPSGTIVESDEADDTNNSNDQAQHLPVTGHNLAELSTVAVSAVLMGTALMLIGRRRA